MSSIKFIQRWGSAKKDAAKEYPINLLYTHKGEKFLISTGMKCKPGKYWDADHGRPKKDPNLDTWLDNFKMKFRTHAVNAVEGEPFAYKVKAAWEACQEKEAQKGKEFEFKGTLLQRWDEYLAYLEKSEYNGVKRTKGTIRNNTNTRHLFARYIDAKKLGAFRIEKFTRDEFRRFESWLKSDTGVRAASNKTGKAKSSNTVSKIKKQLKSFLKWYISEGGSVPFNLSEIKYKETAGIKISLSRDELLTIIKTDFKANNIYRDYLVVQCTTGLRVSDLMRVCDNLTDNNTRFDLRTKKTGKGSMGFILPEAHQVLSRHNYKLPKVTEQGYRDGIKAIYKALWPTKTIEVGQGDNQKRVLVCEEISSHDMVRTFINIALDMEVPVKDVATQTGKSIQVIMKNYWIEDKERAARKVAEKFILSSPLRIAK